MSALAMMVALCPAGKRNRPFFEIKTIHSEVVLFTTINVNVAALLLLLLLAGI